MIDHSIVSEDILNYSRRRAHEEAERALCSSAPEVAAIHRELALAYRKRVAQLAACPGPLIAVTGGVMPLSGMSTTEHAQILA